MSDRLPVMPYRAGLLVIAFAQLGVTVQALFAPKSFYDDFPFGRGWVKAYPDYSEHLVYDYGALTLGALVALVLAAIWLERTAGQVAIAGWLVGATIHLVYHAITIDRFGTGDAIADLVGLSIFVVLPGGLLVRSINEPSTEDPGSTGARAAT